MAIAYGANILGAEVVLPEKDEYRSSKGRERCGGGILGASPPATRFERAL